jgi:D-arabinose 1-dehydrogenase-like Zn-dependent alcohol dehydrogenase
MKAAVITKINSPWEIMEKNTPEPLSGQVLIKIHACGLCGTDLHVHHGLFPVPLPCIPGHEPVGEIVALGAGVIDLKVGDRVGVFWHQRGCGRCQQFQSGLTKYCTQTPKHTDTWVGMGGGMAEYMLAWASGCALLPDNLSYQLAAPLFCAGFTIASGFHNGKPKPGETIGVFGIGGLGHLAIQYAKAKGHPVIAITEHEEKKDIAKALGADTVVVTGRNLVEEVQAAGGIDVLLHTGNASTTITTLLDAMNPEGRIVINGIDKTPFQAPPMTLISKQLRIIGSSQNKRRDLYEILRLASQGKIRPMIETYSLGDIQSVVKKLEEGKVRFRAVVNMES